MKICWFTTGRDKEAFTLLRNVYGAMNNKEIDGYISVLFLNREKGESDSSDEIISFAEEKGTPVECISSKRFFEDKGLKIEDGRIYFDKEVKKKIENYDFDIIFLAGYMLILSRVLFEPYPVLNLHPSLPNAYKGKWEDVIKKTIDDGVKTFGAMIHMVDAALDEGTPVTYVKLALEGGQFDELYNNAYRGDSTSRAALFRIMRQVEFSIETPLIIKTLSMLSRGIIEIRDKSVRYGGKIVTDGIDITQEVCG